MASKTGYINARIDPAIKERAEKILQHLGVKPTQVINMLYHQIILRKGIPFDIEIAEDPAAQASKKERTKRFAKEALADLSDDDVDIFLQHAGEKSNFFGDRN